MNSFILATIGSLIFSISAFANLGSSGEFRASKCGYAATPQGKSEVCLGYIIGADQQRMIKGEFYTLLYLSIDDKQQFVAVDMNPQYGLNNFDLTESDIQLFEVIQGELAPQLDTEAVSARLEKQGNEPVSLSFQLGGALIEVKKFTAVGGAL